MKRTRYIVVLLILVLCSAAVQDARAQMSAQSRDDLPWIVLLGITEGPDPIPQIEYLRVDDIDPGLILVATRAGRDDGRPDVSLRNGKEFVTWSYKVRGQDFDLALAEWQGLHWSPVQIVTFVGEDELDPRAFTAEDGITNIVWWMDGETESVFLVTGESPSWGMPEQVTEFGVSGRRPTVVVQDRTTLVGYERDAAGGGQEIVVASRTDGASFTHEVAHTVDRTEELDVKLHLEQGELWMDWKHSATEFAYCEFVNGTWTEPQLLPWGDPSWAGIQEARETIRQQVLYQ